MAWNGTLADERALKLEIHMKDINSLRGFFYHILSTLIRKGVKNLFAESVRTGVPPFAEFVLVPKKLAYLGVYSNTKLFAHI